MKNTVEQQIREKITYSKYGAVFFVSTFYKFDEEYVTKLLAKFAKEGLIMRISKGVYVKVRKTRFGIVYPSSFELVREIAKRDKVKIIPTGETAANRLGFSTQIPMNTLFLTSGTPRKLILGNRTITLKHGVPKNFAFQGKLMPELVQALRSIGKDNITESVEKRVSQLLVENPESDTIDRDLSLAPVWIRQIVKKNILK